MNIKTNLLVNVIVVQLDFIQIADSVDVNENKNKRRVFNF